MLRHLGIYRLGVWHASLFLRVFIKSFLIFLVLYSVHICQSEAQTKSTPTWISFQLGHQEYYGDFGNEFFDFGLGYDWVLGLSVDHYLSNYFDVELSVTYGELDYKSFFNSSFINFQNVLQFKPMSEPNFVNPYVGTGIGFIPYWYKQFSESGRGVAFNIPLQLGFDIVLDSNISTTASITYNRTLSNNLDGSDFSSRPHDDFMVYSLGIKIGLNRSKDSDGDGIPNDSDICPKEYGESFWGCPDQDGDGIMDREDECPTITGGSGMKGCPDFDRDGIPDHEDSCPKISGELQYSGCPDNDGDGVSHQLDKCPEQPGNADNQGCPEGSDPDSDRDSDGIVDGRDKCPNIQGIVTNYGCPDEETQTERKVLGEEVRIELEKIAENLQFSSNSSEVTPSIQKYLEQLAKIMLEDSDLRLVIRGHTDNTGTPAQNLELSLARANAVRDYLLEQGVVESRVFAFGYGETRPIASNDTEEGRKMNRRVELNLYYN